MIKHILGQAIWQCILLFTFLFGGEYMIPESVPKYMYKEYGLPEGTPDNYINEGFVFPGRASDWSGNDLYTKAMKTDLGPSRHLTFIFNTFVMM